MAGGRVHEYDSGTDSDWDAGLRDEQGVVLDQILQRGRTVGALVRMALSYHGGNCSHSGPLHKAFREGAANLLPFEPRGEQHGQADLPS